MSPNKPCRCRMRFVRHVTLSNHLCAIACPILEHVTAELDYMAAVILRKPVQLRLF